MVIGDHARRMVSMHRQAWVKAAEVLERTEYQCQMKWKSIKGRVNKGIPNPKNPILNENICENPYFNFNLVNFNFTITI